MKLWNINSILNVTDIYMLSTFPMGIFIEPGCTKKIDTAV